MTKYFSLALFLLLAVSSASFAQSALPLADEVDWPRLREQCRHLLKSLDTVKAPLPVESERRLQALLKEEIKDPEKASNAVQQLLDTHCLIGVSINPESRVKAARGPATAGLTLNQSHVVLIKVINQAGVTHALTVRGSELREAGQAKEGAWLEAAVKVCQPSAKSLNGQKLEYVLLRLTPHETGKREATLKFDVGQGTQDLGFRAEVPILFTVQHPSRPEASTRASGVEAPVKYKNPRGSSTSP